MDVREKRQSISSDWAGRLLLSLSLAIMLWGFVTISRDPEQSKTFANVPVATDTVADNLTIITEIPPVNVTVSGPKSTIERLVSTDVSTALKLDEITQPGTYSVSVVAQKPEDVWEVSTSPKTMNIVVENLATQGFPISASYTSADQSQQEVESFVPEVSEVTVTGPESLLSRIASVVLPIDVEGQAGTVVGSYTPVAEDANGQTIAGVTITPNLISASVTVTSRGKEIAVITQLTGAPEPGYEIGERRIIPDTILVDGPDDVLANLIAVNTEPIDISGATGDITRLVELSGLPEGVTVLDPSSGQVRVIVQIRQRGVQQPLPSQQVMVVNLGDGLHATVSPETITLTIIGNEQEIEAISPASLQVQVDAAGLEPGTYEIEPTVILPPNMEWTDIEPSAVTLVIASDSATPAGQTEASPTP
jgi:YbbR domain-containing protein